MEDPRVPAPSDPPALPAREAHPLSDTAIAYARQALAPATRRAYASHLRAWEAWCQSHGALACPAAPSLVANHLAELAGRRAYATLTGRLSAIAQAHALLRLPFEARDPVLRKTLQGIARRHVPSRSARRRRCSPPTCCGSPRSVAATGAANATVR